MAAILRPHLDPRARPGQHPGSMDRALGCDVSHFHPITDAAALYAAGYRFVGLKISEGAGNTDPTALANLAALRTQPFPGVVPYHLFRPGDAAAQARRFLSILAEAGPLAPNEALALDTERTSQAAVSDLDAFFGVLPLDRHRWLYTSNGVWVGMGNPDWDGAASVDVWLPRYGVQEPLVPDPWRARGKSFVAWQDSQGAVVPGVAGPCDENLWRGPEADLEAYFGGAAAP